VVADDGVGVVVADPCLRLHLGAVRCERSPVPDGRVGKAGRTPDQPWSPAGRPTTGTDLLFELLGEPAGRALGPARAVRRVIGYPDVAQLAVAIERDLTRPTIATLTKEAVKLIRDRPSWRPGEERAMPATEQQQPSRAVLGDVSIRPLQEGDLDAADRVMRIAFGTFLVAPDPMTVFGDMDYVRSRFAAEPSWAFAAELDGEVVGSNFATRWGSFGFFGPVTVRVDLWDRGIAGRLMQPIMDLFDQWQVRQAGLFTFPQSPKHIGLYQKFGFWPQYLTPLMEKQVAPTSDRE
jgi:hypothetical protein